MIANMADCKPEEIQIGMPVEVDFFEVGAEHVLPIFRKRQG
jgi:hypothetical protein